MELTTEYPTKQHEEAAKTIIDYFSIKSEIDAVILYGSCARGKASKDSCLDIQILVPPEYLKSGDNSLEKEWEDFYGSDEVLQSLLEVGKFSHVDLNFINGNFKPGYHGWTTGPDEFELEIGNTLVYSDVLWQSGYRIDELKEKWLPYYDEDLRIQRLAKVKSFAYNNLDHIPIFVKRELYFQSFDRLYNAFQEFLQALFISKRIYPIAYDKWVKEQIVDLLDLPDLYIQLRNIISIHDLESNEIELKSKILDELFQRHISEK